MPKLSAPRPRLLAISWPIYAEQLLLAIVGLIFVTVTSRISDATAAAFGLSNQLFGFFLFLFRVVGIGASVVVTQYLGAGERDSAARIARASLAAASWLGLALAVLVASSADALLSLLKLPEELRPEAKPYLMILSLVLLIDSLNTTLASVLRAYTFTRDTLNQMLVIHALSLILGLPLVFGWLGLPRLGLIGIGIAFLLARLAGLVLSLWLWRKHLGIRPRWHDWWWISPKPLVEMMRIGLPGAGENVAYRTAFTWNLSFIATMGTAALATHTYLLQISQFVALSAAAIGFGAEIVVGHLIGAGALHAANRLVRRALVWGFAAAILSASLAALCGPWLMQLFTNDPEIVRSGCTVLWLFIALETGRVFNMVVINSLRGAGDVRFPVVFGAFSMFGAEVGLAWLLGIHMGWGLLGAWIGMAADEWIRAIAMYLRWILHAWVPYARQTRRRLLARKSAAA